MPFLPMNRYWDTNPIESLDAHRSSRPTVVDFTSPFLVCDTLILHEISRHLETESSRWRHGTREPPLRVKFDSCCKQVFDLPRLHDRAAYLCCPQWLLSSHCARLPLLPLFPVTTNSTHLNTTHTSLISLHLSPSIVTILLIAVPTRGCPLEQAYFGVLPP
ncbi:hypothetical protein VTI74DRAFT_780 [Chaetomium olivicolor]